jgi:acyl-CoA synthetase (AMP-forming)/AMP-acid ligase II
MFHDMGLGIALQSITAGATCILLPPRVIVHQPRLWLSAITNYRGSISGAPNFAYDLCVRRINETERAQLDLSCWQVAYNGSEPLRQATLDRFTRAFEVAGFRHSAFHPVYGLAEATVLVRSPPPSQPPLVKKFSTNALRRGKGTVAKDGVGTPLVSHGGPWLDTVVMIVNPRTRKPCDEGEVGEIWIQGSSVARQYWRDDVPSDATVNSSLSGKAAYLCTGDLGFVHENNLYITGRLQDLIVFGEQQYYPQDVESTVAECHSSLVPYGCAAFALEPAEAKHLVVVQEVERTALRKLDRTQVVRTIRDAVLREHGIGPQAVALVRPATLPRTSSGKIRRFSCRAAFLDQSLDTVVTWWATDPLPRSSEAASGCISSKTDPLRAC